MSGLNDGFRFFGKSEIALPRTRQNIDFPENIQKKLLNFGHHNEVEESGPDLNKIRKMVQEKKVYHDHLADKTQEKNREEGYPLKRMDLSELPIYLKKNFNN